MNQASETEKTGKLFGWLSLCVTLVPMGFLALLLTGGGSSGFAVWGDIVLLLATMIGSAVVGIILSSISFRRAEQSVANGIALFIHLAFLILGVWAFFQ